MLKRYWIWVMLAALIAATLIHTYQKETDTIQSLTYYPDDPNINFQNANTTLTLAPSDSSTHYTIDWMIQSKTNSPAYLRQDVGLLFKNGKLIQTSNHWEQNQAVLTFHESVKSSGISHFEALTVHYAETHNEKNQIRSQETMSYDHLYVMANGYQKRDAFKIPIGKNQSDFQLDLRRSLQQEQQYISEAASKKFSLNLADYDVFPLTHLETFGQNSLPNLNQKNSQRVIRQLWEGIYKNYVLGIHVNRTKLESPIGSSVPLIFFPKGGDELHVIIRTKSGRLIQLKQKI